MMNPLLTKRLGIIALLVSTLLLGACSSRPAAPKADLHQAAQAAKIAGENNAANPSKPVQLGPSKQSAQKPVKAGAGVKTTAATGAIAAAKPIQAGPAGGQTAAAEKPVTKIAAAKVLKEVPANGTAIHLASYREIAAAQRGWQILTRSYHELAPLKPLYVAVDLPGKGRVLRLYGAGADSARLKKICSDMQAAGAYCAANIAF